MDIHKSILNTQNFIDYRMIKLFKEITKHALAV